MAIHIIADAKESRSDIIRLLGADPAITVEIRELYAGDYLVADSYPIERKAATDFIASIMDKRLFEQTAKMKAEYGRAAFLIEGDIYATRSAMTPEALLGAVSYLTAIEGATLIPSPNAAASASLIKTIARHVCEGLGYEISLRTAKPRDLRLQAHFLVEGFAGVGPTTAKKLLAHFGSVQALFSASLEDLKRAPGIGDKTAKGIRAVIEAAL